MSAKEPTPPPEGVVRPDPPPAPPTRGDDTTTGTSPGCTCGLPTTAGTPWCRIHSFQGEPQPTSKDWVDLTRANLKHVGTVDESGAFTATPTPLDRIATALERLVELAEQGEPEMDVDIEIDADGKLMHVTADSLTKPGMDLSAYVLAHDPDAAARAAKEWWCATGHVGITGVKVNYDE